MTVDVGGLRSAVEMARRHPENIDIVVWAVLTAPEGQREAWARYATTSLEASNKGHVNLGDVVAWMGQGYDALSHRIRSQYEVAGDTLALFLAGVSWAIVRRPESAPFAALGCSFGQRKTEFVLHGYATAPPPEDTPWRTASVSLWAMADPQRMPEGEGHVVDDVDISVGSLGWAGLESIYDDSSPVSAAIRVREERLAELFGEGKSSDGAHKSEPDEPQSSARAGDSTQEPEERASIVRTRRQTPPRPPQSIEPPVEDPQGEEAGG